MNGVTGDLDGITPADVAERWYARLMSPECTLHEREQFEAWLGKSPEHALAFEETRALWASLEGLEDDEQIGLHVVAALEPDAEPCTRQREGADRHVRPHRRRFGWPVGAGVAAMLVLGMVLVSLRKPAVPEVSYAASDKVESVRLADGSSIRLDLQTRIEVRLGKKRRDIQLQQGRAMFEVAGDAARPFVVDAGVGTVTALGTKFQVQREGERVSVTLLEGSVGIDAAPGGAGVRALRLVPGQRASYAPGTRSWSVEDVDSAALTSWSQGFLVFSATPLRDALAEINRYSNIRLTLADPALGDLRVSGSFKLGDGAAVSEALPYALPVKASKHDGTIVISKR